MTNIKNLYIMDIEKTQSDNTFFRNFMVTVSNYFPREPDSIVQVKYRVQAELYGVTPPLIN